jgi:Ca-activated chloride channel family protein
VRRSLARTILLLGAAGLAGSVVAQRPAPPPPEAASPQQPIVTTVDLVNMVFTVTDRQGKFVTNLSREDFQVFEEGQEQKIEFFSQETDLPLRIGLLLDTSNSIRNRLQFQQEAAIDFLHFVIRRRKDQAFLMTFDNEPAVVEDFTDDVGTLQEAILRQRAGGATALYDAIHFACSQRLMQPPLPTGDHLEVRRVLVLISDGKDSMIYGKSLREALDACQRAEVAIYAISTSTDWMAFRGSDKNKPPEKYHFTEGDKVLAQLAEETGGRAFYPYRRDDLAQSFADIGDELRSQYSLAYVPTNRVADGRFRTVQIKVRDKNLAVRARKGYYAPRPVQPRRIVTDSSSGS